jgi:hypothetical protein
MDDRAETRIEGDRRWSIIAPAIVVAVLQLALTIVVGIAYVGDAWASDTCQLCEQASGAFARTVFIGALAFAWKATLAALVVGFHLRRSLTVVPILSCAVIVGGTLAARFLFDAGL